MGWNPWNAFRTEVTEAKIMGVAETLKSSGLTGAGYRYVNVDDGWWLKRRADGRIEVRTSMFPSAAVGGGETSLRPFVERLHAMGLKAGLYTDIGRNACSQIWDPKSPNLPEGTQAEREVGSFDFQAQDMRLIFGEWKFDFVKVDACGLADYAPGKSAVTGGQYRALGPYIVRERPDLSNAVYVESLYASLNKAIAEVRPAGDAILSICTWGEANAADWARRHGQMWRTSADIHASWESMLHNFDSAARRPLYAGPGRWNDPDMLQIGNGAFDGRHLVGARAHMALWAIISAPLLLGADLTKLPQSLVEIAGNREVIAINQDPAGHQGVTVSRQGDTQAVVKSLAERGAKAVALINRGDKPARMSLSLARLNLALAADVTVRDVWRGDSRKLEGAVITRELGPRETVLLVVKGRPQPANAVYLNEMPANIHVAEDGQGVLAARLDPSWVPAQASAAPSGAPLRVNGKRYDNGIGILSNSRLEVKLDKAYRRFRATAGVQDGAEGAPEVRYSVYGDGKLLVKKTGKGAVRLDVSVDGVRTLELVAEGGVTPPAPVMVAWGDARLEP